MYSCHASEPKPNWQFASAFLAQHQPKKTFYKSTYPPKQSNQCTKTQSRSLFSLENTQRVISIATIIFATIKIYERYQTIGAPWQHDQSWTLAVKQYLVSWCPSVLHSIGIYGAFLVDSTAIVFQALIYKTIAQLLLLCAYGDITDVISSLAQGGAYTVKKLL